jgi:hypothetical protein
MPKGGSCSLPDLHAPGDGTLKWRCQSHGLLVSPKVPAKKRPHWLTTESLTKREYLSKATGNMHCLKSEDYTGISWPMPKMFGAEKYGFTLADIQDPRYVSKACLFSRKLTRLQYEKQIIDLEWRRTYKELIRAEHHERTLPPSASSKTRGMLETQIKEYKDYLLILQDQRDQYEDQLQQVQVECQQIKSTIKQENDLESLRREQVQRVKQAYGPGDEFWQSTFSVASPAHRRPSREWMYNLDE